MKIGQLIGKTKVDQRPLQLISDAYLSASACLMDIRYEKALKLEAKEHLDLQLGEWVIHANEFRAKMCGGPKAKQKMHSARGLAPLLWERIRFKNHKSVFGFMNILSENRLKNYTNLNLKW